MALKSLTAKYVSEKREKEEKQEKVKKGKISYEIKVNIKPKVQRKE